MLTVAKGGSRCLFIVQWEFPIDKIRNIKNELTWIIEEQNQKKHENQVLHHFLVDKT